MLLTYSARTFCQFFLSRETRKLTPRVTLEASMSSDILTWPMATEIHSTWLKGREGGEGKQGEEKDTECFTTNMETSGIATIK